MLYVLVVKNLNHHQNVISTSMFIPFKISTKFVYNFSGILQRTDRPRNGLLTGGN